MLQSTLSHLKQPWPNPPSGRQDLSCRFGAGYSALMGDEVGVHWKQFSFAGAPGSTLVPTAVQRRALSLVGRHDRVVLQINRSGLQHFCASVSAWSFVKRAVAWTSMRADDREHGRPELDSSSSLLQRVWI